MKHALVVGGTGMLSDVSLWLVDQGYHVSIVARNPERMEELMGKTVSSEKITPLFVNYTNEEKLQEQISDTIKKNGNINIVVAWIHSIAENALAIITNKVSKNQKEWELFHILGSSTDLDKIQQKISVPGNCLYHQVQLGFVVENNHSRWLTNKEISLGTITAIKTKQKQMIVGQLEPWEDRP